MIFAISLILVVAVGGSLTPAQRNPAAASRLHATLCESPFAVTFIDWSIDGKLLISGTNDWHFRSEVRVWDIASQEIIFILSGDFGSINCALFSHDCKFLITGSDDNSIQIWDLEKRINLAILKGHKNAVRAIAVCPDCKMFASGSADEIRFWDLESRKCMANVKAEIGLVNSMAFSPDGKSLAIASGVLDGIVTLWDVDRHARIATLPVHRSSPVWSVAFSPDGKLLASGSGGLLGNPGEIKVWDVARGKSIRTLEGHLDAVTSVAFHPNGKVLVSGSYDKTIRLWNVESGKKLATLRGHAAEVFSVIFSPTGKLAASGSGDRTIRLWEIPESVGTNEDGKKSVEGEEGDSLRNRLP